MIRLIYTLLMSALAVFVCYSMTTRAWLQTDLTELLPQSSQDTVLQAPNAPATHKSTVKSSCLPAAPSPKPHFRRHRKLPPYGGKAGYFPK